MARAVLMMYLDLVLFDKRNADAGGKSSILDDIIMREREREREGERKKGSSSRGSAFAPKRSHSHGERNREAAIQVSELRELGLAGFHCLPPFLRLL